VDSVGNVCVCFDQVNLEYLEGKLESLDGDEVMKVKDNINSLFHHCVQALSEEHQIKVVNALQVKHCSYIYIHSSMLQCIYGCGPGQDNLLNSKLNVRMAILSVAWLLVPDGSEYLLETEVMMLKIQI